jgi:hypothetical protein
MKRFFLLLVAALPVAVALLIAGPQMQQNKAPVALFLKPAPPTAQPQPKPKSKGKPMPDILDGLTAAYSTETVTNLTDGDPETYNYFSNGSRAIYATYGALGSCVFTSFEMDVSFIEASDMICRVWGGYEIVSNDIPEPVLLCEFPVDGTGTLSDTIIDETAYPFLKITLEDSASGFPSATISEWRANGTVSGGGSSTRTPGRFLSAALLAK